MAATSEDRTKMEHDIMKYVLKTNKEDDIYYSSRYYDDEYEYRHVNVPKQISRYMPEGRLMTEAEWRSFGVKQSPGWVHYMIHNPEPHILMFRREKDYQVKYPNGKPGVGGLAG